MIAMNTVLERRTNMNNEPKLNRERTVRLPSGWVMLPLVIALILGALAAFIFSIVAGAKNAGHPMWPLFILAILTEAAGLISLAGFFTLQPNEARVLVLFGAYQGTVREPGFYWGNPFYSNGASHGFVARAMQIQSEIAAAKAGTATGSFRKRMSRFKVSLR